MTVAAAIDRTDIAQYLAALVTVYSLIIFAYVLLSLVFYRALRGQFSAANHVGPAAITLYWHFVDLVWVFLYLVLYFAVTGPIASSG